MLDDKEDKTGKGEEGGKDSEAAAVKAAEAIQEKLDAGETLTDEEQAIIDASATGAGSDEEPTVEEIQAKVDAGETLTEEEQAILDSEASEDDKNDDLSSEEKKLLKAAMPRVQKRFDDQTSKIKQLESEIEKLKSAGSDTGKKGDRSIKEYTKEELRTLKKERPEYADYVDEELIARAVDERLGKKTAQTEAQKAAAENEEASLLKYPDLGNPESKLYKLAKTIYEKNGYGRIPDGTMISADKAAEILRKQKKTVKQTDKKRDSDIKKFGMSGASKGHSAGGSSNKRLDELEEKAIGTSPGSPEWRSVIKEQRRLKDLREKANKE